MLTDPPVVENRSRLGFAALLLCVAAVVLGPVDAQQPSSVEPIANPGRDAALLDFGHHVRVKLAREDATSIEIPLRPELLRGADLESLRLARFDPATKRYEKGVPIEWPEGKSGRATVGRSGDYSILGLPADPLGKTAIGALCGIEGRPKPADV